MFSCCRANSKSSKLSKKDKTSKNGEEHEAQDETTNDRKRIIPTIKIESGKTNDSIDEINSSHQNGNETESSTNNTKSVLNNETERDATATADLATVENSQSDEQSKSSATTNVDNKANANINKVNFDETSTAATAISAGPATLATGPQGPQAEEVFIGWKSQGEDTAGTTPVKSCLSRHNSMHTSIKKKVNISTQAEIIEPDPLPPHPYDPASLTVDDDDVFSDSLPPPKRESMCAPYIEPSEIPESVAYGHGLPDWFNDERINDIGCIEPPVTPVGRDELELRRQRLYTDLLRAAHAAVEHNVRFTTFTSDLIPPHQLYQAGDSAAGERGGGGGIEAGDCDPDLKPSVAENLEHLVNRLEHLVERLERSVSARELEIANRTFDTVLAKKCESFDLESTELPPLPIESLTEQISLQAENLNDRIGKIETTLNRINDRHSSSLSTSISQYSQQQRDQEEKQRYTEGSLENISTVLEDYQVSPRPFSTTEEDSLLLPPPPDMSVLGFQDIISGPLRQYLALSEKIGGDVAKHAQLVKLAFNAQLQYVTLATQCAQPNQDKQMALLQPTSTQISAIQDYREKNRGSVFFNHLSAISESIPALGWVCVSPTPGPHVKEMNDAGQFYTNRVLKEWKDKDATHVEWARSWIQTLTELQAYIKQYHTTGLVWSGKGAAPAGAAAPPPPPMGACPPPPPPPAFDMGALSLEDGSADDRSALFAQINQGEAITKNLKKVTDDMQTHKNPTLRTGPAPFKTPTQFGSSAAGGRPAPAVAKEPVFTRDGKKWLIEYQRNNPNLMVDNAEMNNVVYMFKCEGSTLTVKGKVNNVVLDSCKKCSLLFDSVVASVEFVNCQSVQMQVLGFVPTISIDKTDGCQMYLSKESFGVEIVSSKSSEMNVMLPQASGDYTELALPEQFKTTISGQSLKTICVESLG
ncbi:uncharacterized protein LOC128865051 isoform X1 [Anastrepha ludens]|uniref:uncharacterized protein LOC128865051 isoform X1 n=1 Tax=Anastrepha ludens TaxID=28586 RepID=UPI0023AF1919|nr:uncharacterized protein LOC128865051 isoform X1 [Anastrepha ludens]